MGMKKVLRGLVDTLVPEIEERTTLLIDVTAPTDTEGRVYTYAAIYVAGTWYVTGEDRLLATKYASTTDLMSGIARLKNVKIEVVTETEVIR